jgi:hypothetical protein
MRNEKLIYCVHCDRLAKYRIESEFGHEFCFCQRHYNQWLADYKDTDDQDEALQIEREMHDDNI